MGRLCVLPSITLTAILSHRRLINRANRNHLPICVLAASSRQHGLCGGRSRPHPDADGSAFFVQLDDLSEPFPTLLNELSSMSNITLLAPSNMAFETALNSSTGAAFTANNTDVISALFSYHVLNGSYTNFSTMPEFVHTALMPGMYANVTGGQAVEALTSSNMSNATTTFYSGLLQNSTVATNGTFNSTGGVVHVVDHFLVMPENLTNTAVQLNLRSAVGALTVAGLADAVDTMMDATFFVPDNAAFQAIGSALATSTPQELARILQYHVVNGTVGYSSMLTNGSTLTT